MADSRSRLATLICTIVVLTLLVACLAASVALWAGGDWEKHAWGLTLALKIMWGSWLLVLIATLLTHVTIVGWRFRRPRPSEWPAALARAYAEGFQPPAWFKSGPASFAITVVFVSLFGASFVASILLWVIGDWDEYAGPLKLALKIIWGAWWVLAIATVLVRVALFGHEKKRLQRQKEADQAAPEPGPDGGAGKAEQPNEPARRDEP
jgi:hypothetical protein